MAAEHEWEDFTLFEFRAGMMKKTGTQLAADPRRGTIRLLRVRLFASRAFWRGGERGSACWSLALSLAFGVERRLSFRRERGD